MIRFARRAGNPIRLWAFILIILPVFLCAVNPLDNPSGNAEAGFIVTEQDSVSILAVGDLMLAGTMSPVLSQQGADYPFDSLRVIIQNADIAFANLEAPLTTGGKAQEKQYTFKMKPEVISGILNAGFDLCTLANNHILDFGLDGLIQTFQVLDQAGLGHCGAGMNRKEAEQCWITNCKGIRVGFLAYSLTYPESFWATSSRCGTAYPHSSTLEKDIPDLKKKADVVVVSFHWGGERMERPKYYQREYAHRVIDLGADIVIGHHPHVLQGAEKYQNKLILYSLGNFAFGSTNPYYKEGGMAEIWIDRDGLRSAEVIPIDVDNRQSRFQPQLIRGKRRTEVIDYINSISESSSDCPPLLPSGKIIFH